MAALWLSIEEKSADLVTGLKIDGKLLDDEVGSWAWVLAVLTP